MSRAKLRRYVRHGLLPQLFVFEAVARLGSVTRAAEELHLAQPTVSTQLKKLSDALEVQLFEQRGRRLHLTAAGHALREVCDELMHCLARAEARLAAWRAPQTETLLLAAEPRARHIASQLLAAFCAGHPGVQGRLHIAERAELLERFGACKDDVYLFELQLEGFPEQGRWTVAHAKGRDLAQSAAQFLREALAADRNGEEVRREETGLPPRPTTRR
jgi:LysR family transcriptional regulator, low CO2-responsive transcriptional regulator